MKNTFVVSCPIDTYSGYGARARDFVKALIELDKYDVKIMAQIWGKTAEGFIKNNFKEWGFLEKHIIPNLTEQPDYWCQITVPNEFQAVGKFNIGLTAGMETTIVHGSWIEGCNRMDLILTSSEHSKTTFLNSKFHKDNNPNNIVELQKPIKVLIKGLNLDVYQKTKVFENGELYDTVNSIPEKFAYLNVGHWMQGDIGHDRKNIGLTIKAFYEIFKNRKNAPALILKVCIVNGSIMDKSEVLRRLKLIKDSVGGAKSLPNVYLIHGNFTNKEINELYNHPKVKAMVSLTKGEGYGRPLLEFSAVDKPIIASDWSGHIDFLKKPNTALVKGTLENVHPTAAVQNMILQESQWFKPDPSEVGYLINNVFEDHKTWAKKAKTQGNFSRKNFSFEVMKNQIAEIMENDAPDLPKKMELKLPSMSKIKMPSKTKMKKV